MTAIHPHFVMTGVRGIPTAKTTKADDQSNFWLEGKKHAPTIWRDIQRTFDRRALNAARAWDRGSAENFWTWVALGQAADNWTTAQICSFAPQLAKLGPSSWTGAAFDILSLSRAGFLIKGIRWLAGAVRGTKIAKTANTTRVLETYLKESVQAGEVAVSGAGQWRHVQALGKWVHVPKPSGVGHHVGHILDRTAAGAAKHATLLANQQVRLGKLAASRAYHGFTGPKPLPITPNTHKTPLTPKSVTGAPKYPIGKKRSRPFDWSSNRIPPKKLQSSFRAPRGGQAGWGEHLTLTQRPAPGSLRWYGQGLSRTAPQQGSLRWIGQGLR